jgi:hypothetical protein
LWYVWFIDNLYIGNMVNNIRFDGSDLLSRSMDAQRSIDNSRITPSELTRGMDRSVATRNLPFSRSALQTSTRANERSLTGYKVWRLVAGQEANEATWTSLTAETITTLTHSDNAWASLPNGTYKWAVKAIYTSNVASAAAFSNPLVKEVVNGTLVGFVRRTNNQGIPGAVVSAGGFTATTNNAGAFSLVLPAGVYSATATATGYHPRTIDNITIAPNQNTTQNFIMTSTANEDEVVPVSATALVGNFPNPFNPETTINYTIKEPVNVRLDVYNLKGQLVRTLVNADQASGRYRVVFTASDEKGSPLASGIYFYRLSAGNYTSTRKMMLME